MTATEASTCPLCQRANECAMEKGSTGCWCESVSIPAAVLEQIPAAQKGRVCVCRDCAERGREAGTTSGSS